MWKTINIPIHSKIIFFKRIQIRIFRLYFYLIQSGPVTLEDSWSDNIFIFLNICLFSLFFNIYLPDSFPQNCPVWKTFAFIFLKTMKLNYKETLGTNVQSRRQQLCCTILAYRKPNKMSAYVVETGGQDSCKCPFLAFWWQLLKQQLFPILLKLND